MTWTNLHKSSRTLLYSAAVLAFTAVALFIGAKYKTIEASPSITGNNAVPSATFAADAGSLGAIPDATACGPTPGTPKNVTFTTSGLSGAVSAVDLSMTFGSPNHTFMGDIIATLIAPNGASHTIFGRTLATTATALGDSSDLGATYVFSDTAPAPPNGGWWQAATVATAAVVMPTGTYRTTASGGAGQTNPAPPTVMNASFTGVANANGTWTLRLTDGCTADTGSITAATLSVTTASVTSDAPVDMNGDGRTDFVVVRNTGGGPSGQITWFIQTNGSGIVSGAQWGVSGDIFTPVDFDGDSKDDVAVWRPGAPGTAAFYILQSATSTVRIELFGQSGDDPTVVGDYNGDGRDDVAVYRAGANAGDQSTWFYRTTAGGPVAYVPWGQNGDFVAPGDYDGDGRNDFVIQRNNGGGQARFWMFQTTAGFNSVVFGTPTDVVVPGDYDGDGKTDLATVRGSGGQIIWFVRPSSTGVISAAPYATFGLSATDFPTQGDYDGDGKTDVAVWRPNADPTQNFFYILGSTSGVTQAEWGQNGDNPVANYNSH